MTEVELNVKRLGIDLKRARLQAVSIVLIKHTHDDGLLFGQRGSHDPALSDLTMTNVIR